MGNVLGKERQQRNAIELARKERDLSIEHVRLFAADLADALRDDILSLSLPDLINGLQTSEYTATQVLQAYIFKAIEVQERFNCICEFLLEAIEIAHELDCKFKDGSKKPPLFGVPFSVKSNFHMKNHDNSVGLANKIHMPSDDECTLVTQLKELGAVPFVLTNVPQTLLSFSCSNPVYGTTLNPHDITRTPGGSSGGEACLLAAGGTPFATGSDIGGSLRIPAAFCGVVSLKPTQDRLIVENVEPGLPGRCRLGLSYGFFTKTVEDQCFLNSLVYGTDVYRRLIVRNQSSTPFNRKIVDEFSDSEKHLRIGYFSNDGFIPAIPGYARVIDETVNRLRARGHEMIEFQIPHALHAAYCLFREILPDGGAFILDQFKNNIVDDNMRSFFYLLRMPIFLRYVASLFFFYSSPQIHVMARSYVSTAVDVRMANADLDEYNKEFLHLWESLNIDALICPGFTVSAVKHYEPSKIGGCAFSSALYNMLDYPAGIVPVDKVTEIDDANLLNPIIYPTNTNLMLSMVRRAAENSIGLPLSVQVVTKPFEEEKCLAVMKLVEAVWKNE